jgi:hypothetical protein
MQRDPVHFFFWSIVIHEREFRILVRHDGAIDWIEDGAVVQAGGRQPLEDFVSGAIFGDSAAARRALNRMDEFTITTPSDDTARPLLDKAGQVYADDSEWPEGLGDALDIFFLEQFWEHVNPFLPNPLTNENWLLSKICGRTLVRVDLQVCDREIFVAGQSCDNHKLFSYTD